MFGLAVCLDSNMKVLKKTSYKHLYDGNGKKLKTPCSGYLTIIDIDGQVNVWCETCNQGYGFKFNLNYDKQD